MDQGRLWDEVVGAGWIRHADFIDAQSHVFGRAAMDRLGSIEGCAALDVGCGTGATTLDLASLGADSVLGIDLSSRMIEHARHSAAAGHVARVTFAAQDVTSLEGGERFDVIFSRFGVMFFEDATDGFRSLRRLASPDARLAFAAWTDPFTNPWMMVPVLASADVLGPPTLPAPGAPGPFSLGSEDRVREVLNGAGWTDVRVEALSADQPFGTGGAASTAAAIMTTNPVLALGLLDSPEKAPALLDVLTDALVSHEVDGVVHMGASALIVSALG